MSKKFACFIIMPYARASDEIYRSAILPVLREHENILPLRADEIGPTPLTLKAKIENAVDTADFCIVDLSGNNPNVMYEFGYANARGKPIIAIRSKDTRETPVSISSIRLITYDREENLSDFKNALSAACANIIRALQPELLRKNQKTITIYESDKNISELFIASVRFRFAAMVPSPKFLVDSFLPHLHVPLPKNFAARIVCAIPGTDPLRLVGSESLADRLSHRERRVVEIATLVRILQDENFSYEVRLTDRIMTGSIYLSDTRAIFAPILSGKRFSPSLALEIDAVDNERLFKVLLETFDSVWAESVPVNLAALKDIALR